MRTPTSRRSEVKIVFAMACARARNIRAIEISLALLKSGNSRPEDRIIVMRPEMVAFPWKGKLPTIATDPEPHPRNRHGFLLLRPLYGGRDAPMRWWITLSKRLRSHGFTQLQSDVCMFAKYDIRGILLPPIHGMSRGRNPLYWHGARSGTDRARSSHLSLWRR